MPSGICRGYAADSPESCANRIRGVSICSTRCANRFHAGRGRIQGIESYPDRARSHGAALGILPRRMNASVSNAELVAEVLQDLRELGVEVTAPAADSVPSTVGFPADLARVQSWSEFEERLSRHAREVIVARDWPVVLRAWDLAQQGLSRELVALDHSWDPGDGPGMAEASWRVGRRQLNRLRPLRDLRVVQKYLSAIDAGTARGWHPMVFGVVMAAFGIPLRQGLVHYATQTATGWCDAVLRIREWSREEGELSVDRVCAPLSRFMPPLPNSELFVGRNPAPGV